MNISKHNLSPSSLLFNSLDGRVRERANSTHSMDILAGGSDIISQDSSEIRLSELIE